MPLSKRRHHKREQLDTLNLRYREAFRDLYPQANFVPGDGDVDSVIAIIGEAPGRRENEEKRPFVGDSGKLLMEALQAAGIDRDCCYITNLCKYRPPGNRDPETADVPPMTTMLRWEIGIVKPRIVITAGGFSNYLFFQNRWIGDVQHKLWELQGYYVIPAYHPAYILRNRHMKAAYINGIRNRLHEAMGHLE